MSTFEIIAALLTLTATGSYLNQRYAKFPMTIGLMAFAFLISLSVIALDKLGLTDLSLAKTYISQIDFSDILLHGMLSFLLFAGALHINFSQLERVKWSVIILATAGVILATFITGSLIFFGANLVGLGLPYIYALLFGALISPTDPIAVLSVLKATGVSKSLYAKIGGESLFNDGIGVVIFLTIFGLTKGSQKPEFFGISFLLIQQVMGGAIVGFLLGWITYRLIRSIDAYKVELLLTLALASGGYVLADKLHTSAPICMVVAGLVVGNQGRKRGMSEETRYRLDSFWEMLDDVLNSVLFILIGLEVVIISLTGRHVALGVLAIGAVLIGRVISVGIPTGLMELGKRFDWKSVGLLTWGGLRGGLSVAMALALPSGPEKDIILSSTYIVVLFSILVQGLTFKSSLKFLVKH